MRRIPIYFSPDITQAEMRAAMCAAGLHLSVDAGAILVVDRVPAIVAKDPPQTNVVKMPVERKRRVGT